MSEDTVTKYCHILNKSAYLPITIFEASFDPFSEDKQTKDLFVFYRYICLHYVHFLVACIINSNICISKILEELMHEPSRHC